MDSSFSHKLFLVPSLPCLLSFTVLIYIVVIKTWLHFFFFCTLVRHFNCTFLQNFLLYETVFFYLFKQQFLHTTRTHDDELGLQRVHQRPFYRKDWLTRMNSPQVLLEVRSFADSLGQLVGWKNKRRRCSTHATGCFLRGFFFATTTCGLTRLLFLLGFLLNRQVYRRIIQRRIPPPNSPKKNRRTANQRGGKILNNNTCGFVPDREQTGTTHIHSPSKRSRIST